MSNEIELLSTGNPSLLNIPVLPLRDVVVYPHMVIPLFVGRDKSIKALEAAMLDSKQIFLVAQRKSANDDPTPDDLFTVGTISSVLQLLKLPDGTVKVLVEESSVLRLNLTLQKKVTFLLFYKILMRSVMRLRIRILKFLRVLSCLNLNNTSNLIKKYHPKY